MSSSGRGKDSKKPEPVKVSEDVEMEDVNDNPTWSVGVKPRQPKAFNGDRRELDPFLYSLEIYFSIADPKDRMSEEQKTLTASSYLEGSAARWFQPYLKDRITKANTFDKTKTMFRDFEAFKQELMNIFGITNETRRAEIQLTNLRQKTGVVSYATEFQRLFHSTKWGEASGQAHFYNGLKNHIKDQLALKDRQPQTLQELMLVATQIDDRFQERHWETRFDHSSRKEHGKNKHKYRSEHKDDPYGPTPMDVDIARVKKFPLYQQKNKKKHDDKKGKGRAKTKKGKCFNCQKEGHYAKDCLSPKKARADVKLSEVQVLISRTDEEGIERIDDDTVTTSSSETSSESEESRSSNDQESEGQVEEVYQTED
jgi:hypothetical protein